MSKITIDMLNLPSIRLNQQRTDALLVYYHKYYSYFQNEYSKIIDKLKNALNKNAFSNFQFKAWRRVISFKYSDDPLSAKGSVLNDPGGRFNIGDIDKLKFPCFPALYIAQDYETAYREKFQKKSINTQFNGLTSDELSLNRESVSNILVEGTIHHVFDLSKAKNLKDFFNEINRNIKTPKDFYSDTRKLNLSVEVAESVDEFKKIILEEHWRLMPMQFDIPSYSQIFGQIASIAGIEAILYPSKMNAHKKCLAIFVKNFEYSDSFVSIVGEVPNSVKFSILDSNTFQYLT